jgi:hypothetical protein
VRWCLLPRHLRGPLSVRCSSLAFPLSTPLRFPSLTLLRHHPSTLSSSSSVLLTSFMSKQLQTPSPHSSFFLVSTFLSFTISFPLPFRIVFPSAVTTSPAHVEFPLSSSCQRSKWRSLALFPLCLLRYRGFVRVCWVSHACNLSSVLFPPLFCASRSPLRRYRQQ